MLAARYAGPTAFFDLEDPRDIARLSDPMLALADLRGMTPEALEALRGSGLESPAAIVEAGRLRLGEVLASPEQADEVFAAAQEWTANRASSTAPPTGEVAPAAETESA